MEPLARHTAAAGGGASLHTCVPCRRRLIYRIYAVVHACGIVALLYHHAQKLLHAKTLISSLFLISDIILAFMWTTTQAFRFNPVHRFEFPENFKPKSAERGGGFPGLDVFICTADPYKEPPTIVVNTALSVMAYDYPPDRISVYVSDDGGSSLTLFALMEAARFSKHWLPFCKKNNIQDRSPEAYFASDIHSWTDEARNIKIMYEDMKMRVELVVERGKVEDKYINVEQEREMFSLWTDTFTRHDHPTIIQVLLDSNMDRDKSGSVMPNLIYVSREKSTSSPHHFKAGALNTLLRVSGVMTNSPVILTVDCDMYSNDPETPLRALCYISDPKINSELAFVQFPQRFPGLNETDIYACEFKRLFLLNMIGYDGLRGPFYLGSGAFFNRRAFFGGPSNLVSPELDKLRPNRIVEKPIKALEVLALAHKVAGCNYENNTNWGSKIGFRYGSLVEDYYTSYKLHCEGWRSVFCNPKRPAFYGDAPISLFDVVSQQKRWSIGLLEVTFSRYSTLIYGIGSLGLLTGLTFCHQSFWPFWSIPLTIYGILPQLALLHGVTVFPEISNPWFFLYIFLFLGGYGQDLLDFVLEGGTLRRWWNDQRMWMIRGVSSFFFGFIEFSLKTLKISTHGFNLTNKVPNDEQSKRYDQGIFDFGVSSPLFLPMATAAVLNLFALFRGLVCLVVHGVDGRGGGFVLEVLLAGFVTMNCLPVYEAMVLRKDRGKLPAQFCYFACFLSWVLYILAYFFLK